MAENKSGFLLYADYKNIFDQLTDAEAGILVKHLFAYVNDEDPELDDRMLKIVFEPIKLQLKRDLKSWESKKGKSSEAGILGNLKRWYPDLYRKVQKGKLSIEDAVKEADNRKISGSDKPDKKNRNPINSIAKIAVTDNVTVNDTVTVTDTNRANALVAADAAPEVSKSAYKTLVEANTGKDLKDVWVILKDFINTKKPPFIEPYFDAWNLFAVHYKLPKVEVLNDARRKKFKTRIDEAGFDFVKVLEKIKLSDLLLGKVGTWKVTFDWVLENQTNYVRILEGNYDN